MKKFFAPLLVGASLFALVGCNPEGTCVVPDHSPGSPDSLGDSCIVNATKNLCSSHKDGTFFPEKPAAGLIRCKMEGFSDLGTPPSRPDPKSVRILYRKTPKATK